jgi:phosphate-selective porin OprO/OprP
MTSRQLLTMILWVPVASVILLFAIPASCAAQSNQDLEPGVYQERLDGLPSDPDVLDPHNNEPIPENPRPDQNDEFRLRLESLEEKWKQSQQAVPAKSEKPSSGTPTFKLGGQFVIDGLWFNQNSRSRAAVGDIDDAFDFRRARLYGSGEAYEIFSYTMGFDFAQGTATNGRPTFLDNWVQIKDLPWVNNLRIGHFFEPFSLERSTSNRNVSFMERSLGDALAPARNTGLMFFNQTEDESLFWALGTFRGNSDNFGDDEGDQEGQTIDTRIVYRPFYDEATNGRSMLHLGYAYSFRGAADGVIQFRSRPEAFGHSDSESTTTPYFADTGVINANHTQLHGLEMVWVNGPLSIQGEYMAAAVDRSDGRDVTFHGGYIYASYFLTGEHRPYNRASATMDRLVPINNFVRLPGTSGPLIQGYGAWELAARLSQIDLTNQDIQGGRSTDMTIGLNWYLTPYNRMKFNYILAHRDQTGDGGSNTSIFGIRFDTDF